MPFFFPNNVYYDGMFITAKAKAKLSECIDLFNVIVFIQATDHVITILCHVTNNCGWQKHFRFH